MSCCGSQRDQQIWKAWGQVGGRTVCVGGRMTWVKQESGRDPATGFHPAVERRASLKLGARRDGLDPPLELHAWVPTQPWCWNVPTSAPALALGQSPLLHLA